MRQPGNKKPKEKGTIISSGPNWVMSLEDMTNLWVFKVTHFQWPFMGATDATGGGLLCSRAK